MRIINLCLLFSPLLLISNSCKSQRLIPISPDTTVLLFDILWDVQSEYIQNFMPDGDFFYKTIALPLSEGDSNMGGEIVHRLYVIKGEYGEYKTGVLFRVGDFYNIQDIRIQVENQGTTLTIRFGAKHSPEELKFTIP